MAFSCPLHNWYSAYDPCPLCVTTVTTISITDNTIPATPMSIKEECELQYKKINDAEERLVELRSVCKHENTFVGNYSWRVGCISPATICSDCGKLIKYAESFLITKLNEEGS